METNFASVIEKAAVRIGERIRKTPLEYSYPLSVEGSGGVFLKLECLQYTRSFKLRGALNKLLRLTSEEQQKGVIAASTGNHALALAHGLRELGISGTIYLPENASARKIEVLNRYGVELVFYGTDSVDTERYARAQAEEHQRVYVSPYNDPEIVAGQGTVGVELLEQLSEVDSVFVPVGGGGLISGIASYLKVKRPSIRVVGCLPKNSSVMYDSINAGTIVDWIPQPTLSDGTAGGIEKDAITFELCKQLVDDWITVSEDEIQAAMKLLFEEHGLVVEGAAGVSVAAYQKYKEQSLGYAVVVLCGGNVDIELFKKLVW